MSYSLVTRLRQPVLLDVAGLLYEVEPRSFQEWAEALAEPVPLLALLDLPAARRLNSRMRDRYDPLDTEHLNDGWHEALAAHSGLSWWEAERLLATGMSAWVTVSGEASMRGLDLLESPLDQALAFIRALVMRGAKDEKERRSLEQQLTVPPVEEVTTKKADPRPGFAPEEQGSAWASAARGQGVRT